VLAEGLLAGRPVTNEREAFVARQLLEAGHAHPIGDGPPGLGVTAVVPVRDRPAALARCLDALAVPTVVVDDGSREPAVLQRICDRPGVTLVRRERNGGPAAARNTALDLISTDAVLFVDSDVVVGPDTHERLATHLADPRVAAVAPRVLPAPGGEGVLARHLAGRSPLDLGPDPALARPGGPVGYVPSACLLVRTSTLHPFAEELRYGEDVDLIWRLTDDGADVVYDPSITVSHSEPVTWRTALARRHHYGTSAGPLAVRHPGGRLAPYRAAPVPALGALAVALAPLPVGALAAAAVTASSAVRLARASLPAPAAVAYAARGAVHSSTALGRYALGVGAPMTALLLALSGRRREQAARIIALALLGQLLDRRGTGDLDPVRGAAATALDDLAYASGVWRGALAARTIDPLLPRLH
jgi:mycofactocin system glycosyltransferase